MNTRFYNCKILTLCKDDEITENCELWVEGNKISYIGKPKTVHFHLTEKSTATEIWLCLLLKTVMVME